VASSMAVPLLLEDAHTYGALNIYGTDAHGFSDRDAEIAEGFAEQASVVVANVVAYWTAFDLSRNLTAAMEHRGVIEQAKGILMGAMRCTADEAFGMLRQRSQVENRKLRDIAIETVQSVQPVEEG
jgi:ANTAR domain/GAF domain